MSLHSAAHLLAKLNRLPVGPHAVRTGQKVYFNDSQMSLSPVNVKDSGVAKRAPEVTLRFYLDYVDPMFQPGAPGMQDLIPETIVTAATALFGGDPVAFSSSPNTQTPLRFGHGAGVRVVRFPDNPLGCASYAVDAFREDEAVVVRRGECTFLEKLVFALRAGASGVVVLGDEDNHINPSADRAELDAARADADIDGGAIVVLRRPDARLVEQILDAAERHDVGAVRLVIEPAGERAEAEQQQRGTATQEAKDDVTRVLYLNNHPLLNTRLLI